MMYEIVCASQFFNEYHTIEIEIDDPPKGFRVGTHLSLDWIDLPSELRRSLGVDILTHGAKRGPALVEFRQAGESFLVSTESHPDLVVALEWIEGVSRTAAIARDRFLAAELDRVEPPPDSDFGEYFL